MSVPANILARKNQIAVEVKLHRMAKKLGLSKMKKTSTRLHYEGTRRVYVRNEILVNGKVLARYGVGMNTLYWMEISPSAPEVELNQATVEDQ